MHRSGILILTKHVSSLCHGDVVKRIVAGVKKVVSSTLYVHVENTTPKPRELDLTDTTLLTDVMQEEVRLQTVSEDFSPDVFPFLWKFYSEAATQCQGLDVNILLHNIGYKNPPKHKLYRPIQCIIGDYDPQSIQSQNAHQVLRQFVSLHYATEMPHNTKMPVFDIAEYCKKDLIDATYDTKQSQCKKKGDVVLGGTFDHVHTGHKLLLSEAVLLADKRIVIGVTDADLLKRKTLPELIKPWTAREKQVEDFLKEIANVHTTSSSDKPDSSSVLLEITRIDDPIGPAGTDPDLKCIIVSKETERGGKVVNEARLKNGLNPLYVHVITGGVLGTDSDSSHSINESKVSSSTLRFAMLGTLLAPPNTRTPKHVEGAYVIGLTGGIASGKTAIGKRLQRLGATIVDCDKLGHKAYEPGTDTFEKVVQRFGNEIVDESGVINRKVLASKVFAGDDKKANLMDLNKIVWPEIERLARLEIGKAIQDHNPSSSTLPKPVCVLDAAVLLEAGWDQFSDEVWVSIVPPAEAVKRVVNRDGRTAEDAENRLRSQITNGERVKRAHVVLSTLWEPEVTQKQVEKAWALLGERLKPEWTYKPQAEESKL